MASVTTKAHSLDLELELSSRLVQVVVLFSVLVMLLITNSSDRERNGGYSGPIEQWLPESQDQC